MIINLYPKNDFKYDNELFCKGIKYCAIVVDCWKDGNDCANDIIGLEITGGYLSRKIIAFTRKEIEDNFQISTKDEEV